MLTRQKRLYSRGWSSTVGEVPPLAQALVHPSEPWVRAAAYDPWAKREARGLDGDLRGGVHWLRGGGGDGGSSGLWEYGRRGL